MNYTYFYGILIITYNVDKLGIELQDVVCLICYGNNRLKCCQIILINIKS
jgi:hypothetical protein